MPGIHLRKYGAATTINFQLFEADGVDFRTDAVHAAGDTKIMKDEGAEANTTNGFTDEGQGYSLALTATEMEAARIVVYVVDQTATKVWLDTTVIIETYGNASAQHAIDLDDSVRAGLTALPNAAADAAGGLPISDAGGLDIDAIKAKTDNLPADPADDSDIDAQLSTIDTVVDAIKAITDNLPDGGALTSLGSTDNAAIADAVWDEALSGHTTAGTAGKALGVATAAPGSTVFTYTLTSSVDSSAIANALVWVTTTNDPDDNIIAQGYTDTSGQVTFYLDAGTYYLWRQKSGYTFTNPDTETIA